MLKNYASIIGWSLFTANTDQVKKQGWSLTPADILVGIMSFLTQLNYDYLPTKLSADVGEHPYFFTF